MLGISLWKHQHPMGGITLHFSLMPPFVLPTPVIGIVDAAFKHADKGKVSFKDHEHSPVGLPSASIDTSSQQRLGNRFLVHAHMLEEAGLDLKGLFTSVITFTPPPFSN